MEAGLRREGRVRKRKRCECGREQHLCKDCGGVSICQHGRERRRCKDCRSAGIFEASVPSRQALASDTSSEGRGAFFKVIVAAAPAGGVGESGNARRKGFMREGA